MSDSDEAPLIVRKPKAAAAMTVREEVKEEPASPTPAAKPAQDAPQLQLEAPAAIIKEESDDDKPIAASRKAKAAKAESKPNTKLRAVPKAEPEPKAKAAPPAKVKKEAGDWPSSSNVTNATNGDVKVKKERKEYDLPGQTRETPPETDPLRKFYTSLLQQRPDSEMAKKWCLQCGLLEQDEALKVMKGMGKSPAKPAAKRPSISKEPAPKRPAKVKAEPKEEAAKRPRAKVKYEDDSDDEAPKPKGKAAAKEKKGSSSEEEVEESSDDDKPLAKVTKKRPMAAAAKDAPAKRPAAAARRLVDDDSDDDDDKPLAAVRRAKA